MLYVEDRAHFAFSCIRQAAADDRAARIACARGELSAPGEDRRRKTKSCQRRAFTHTPFRHRWYPRRRDSDGAGKRDIREREGADHVSAERTTENGCERSVLWEHPIE